MARVSNWRVLSSIATEGFPTPGHSGETTCCEKDLTQLAEEEPQASSAFPESPGV